MCQTDIYVVLQSLNANTKLLSLFQTASVTEVSTSSTNGPEGPSVASGNAEPTTNGLNPATPVEEMTSKDYYFDSYAHFGIHEVSFALNTK